MALATIKLFLDTRQMQVEGIGMVKVLTTFKRQQKLYTTGIKVSSIDWAKLQRNVDENGLSSKLRDNKFIDLYTQLYGENSSLKRAKVILEKLGDDFTFEDFKYLFSKPTESVEISNKGTNNILFALENKSKDMLKNDRISSADLYQTVANSLKRFLTSLSNDERFELKLPILSKNKIEKPLLDFIHITPVFLLKYEKWMLRFGKMAQKSGGVATPASQTTVGIYLRQLRTIYNDAIGKGIVNRDLYPFAQKGYVIPSGRNEKKALTKEEVKKIMIYEAQPDSFEQRSRDLWIFSYLSNGMNFSDICRLTWGDVNGTQVKFIRKKTANSKKSDQKKITVTLFAESFEIIKRWGNKDKSQDAYLFPFVNVGMDERHKKATIHQVIKITNKWVNRIAEKLGIEGDVNTYHARHSFATILLRSDVPIPFISQSLGHSNIATTEAYLGSFEDEQVQGYLKALI
jgi:integrase